MRRRSLVAAVLLLGTVFAGCVTPTPGSGPDTASAPGAAGSLSAADVDVPSGAEVEAFEGGVRIVWPDAELPFDREIPVPEDATVVRAKAEASAPVFTFMTHAETGAYRCSPELVDGWNQPASGTVTCSGATALDPLPTKWRLEVGARTSNATVDAVAVEYVDEPLGGLAGDLELGNLSTPRHETTETETTYVESHDGTRLNVEVTRPDVDEPVPTILISSPYNTLDRANGARPYDEMVRDYVPRGYAVVVADVRGFGQSEGCVEVWGPDEQRDQKVLVDWITEQDWSDGKVGFTGVSYVGTTPIEAAVQAPDGLEAIVAIAGVVNAYQDWHFGGVPNGENWGSPAAYQAIGTASTPRPMEPLHTARTLGNGLCKADLAPGANDPRALYDDFYAVRNFSDRADQVEAAVMYEHGFEDPNVKSSMVTDWFNDLDVTKLGLYGHWEHQWATRADQFLLRHAWMDQFVMGRDIGLEGTSQARVTDDAGTERVADQWPPTDATETTLWPAFDDGQWADAPSDGSAAIPLDGTGALAEASGAAGAADPTQVTLTRSVDDPLKISGRATVDLSASLEGTANAHVYAALHEVDDDGDRRLVTFGMANLAHREGHKTWDPVAPDETAEMGLHLLPTEHTFEPGDTLEIVLRSARHDDWSSRLQPDPAGELVLHGGEDGTQLILPTVPADAGHERPPSAIE